MDSIDNATGNNKNDLDSLSDVNSDDKELRELKFSSSTFTNRLIFTPPANKASEEVFDNSIKQLSPARYSTFERILDLRSNYSPIDNFDSIIQTSEESISDLPINTVDVNYFEDVINLYFKKIYLSDILSERKCYDSCETEIVYPDKEVAIK